MLILSRTTKPGKRGIWIDGTYVQVLSVDKRTGLVRLGIDAPKEIRVLREELAPFRQEKKTA